MTEYKTPLFLWRNMPRMGTPSSQTFEGFLDSARSRGVFEANSKMTLQQITEAKAFFFDTWVWKGCRDSKRMAEFYEALELEVISNRESWRTLAEGIAKNRTKKKGNYLLVNKETLREFEEINIREAEKEIAQLRAAGFNKRSSVNTKSISGDTNDDAASLTSKPIHKRLDHSDK